MPLRETIAGIKNNSVTDVDLSKETMFESVLPVNSGMIVGTWPYAASNEDGMTSQEKDKIQNWKTDVSWDIREKYYDCVNHIGKCLEIFSHRANQLTVFFDKASLVFEAKTQTYTSLLQRKEIWKMTNGSRVKFSSDGRLMLNCGEGIKIEVFNLETKESAYTESFEHAPSVILDVCNDRFAAGYRGGIRIWAIGTKELISLATLQDDSNQRIVFLKFVQNNEYILTGTFEGVAKLWCLKTSKCVATFNHEQSKSIFHKKNDSYRVMYALSPTGLLVSCVCAVKDKQSIKLWDLNKRCCVATYNPPKDEFIFVNPSFQFLSSSSLAIVTVKDVLESNRFFKYKPSFTALDFSTGKWRTLFTAESGDVIYSVNILSDGQFAAIVNNPFWELGVGGYFAMGDTKLKVWDSTSGKCSMIFDIEKQRVSTTVDDGCVIITNHNQPIIDINHENGQKLFVDDMLVTVNTKGIALYQFKTRLLKFMDLQSILEVLADNVSVLNLKLPFAIDDYSIPALITFLRRNTTLIKLDARNTSITKEGIEKLLDAIRHRLPKIEICYGINVTVYSAGELRSKDEKIFNTAIAAVKPSDTIYTELVSASLSISESTFTPLVPTGIAEENVHHRVLDLEQKTSNETSVAEVPLLLDAATVVQLQQLSLARLPERVNALEDKTKYLDEKVLLSLKGRSESLLSMLAQDFLNRTEDKLHQIILDDEDLLSYYSTLSVLLCGTNNACQGIFAEYGMNGKKYPVDYIARTCDQLKNITGIGIVPQLISIFIEAKTSIDKAKEVDNLEKFFIKAFNPEDKLRHFARLMTFAKRHEIKKEAQKNLSVIKKF